MQFYRNNNTWIFVAECVDGLYLYGGLCEAICPPKTYPGTNSKEKAECLPCHYTCLTCTGETDGHCTSCHDEAVPIPSELKVGNEAKLEKLSVETKQKVDEGIMTGWKSDVEIQDLTPSNENTHLSWGKRGVEFFFKQVKPPFSKKAVTKKILEPYNSPRLLYYCYSPRMLHQMKFSSSWYYKMSVLFALNLILLIVILSFLIWRKFCHKKSQGQGNDLRYKYFKMNNSNPIKAINGEKIIYLSSSSDEDDEILVSRNKPAAPKS